METNVNVQKSVPVQFVPFATVATETILNVPKNVSVHLRAVQHFPQRRDTNANSILDVEFCSVNIGKIKNVYDSCQFSGDDVATKTGDVHKVAELTPKPLPKRLKRK